MSIIHTYFRLFSIYVISEENKLLPLTHHTWKMSSHYFVKCTTFSSDWRYVAFLQTLVALKKSQLWVGIGGSEKNWLWYVANGISDKLRFSRKGASPTNHCWCQKTRVIAVSCGIKISAVHHLVLSQYTRLTDRRTDRQTDRRLQGLGINVICHSS